LGWVLYGIAQHPKLSKWVFKGGTCLKKCYFKTYRFSDDLDFTVLAGSIYDTNGIKNALIDVANFIYQATGINLQSREIEVKESINKRKYKTYEVKTTYSGPLTLPSCSQQRIKFDITNDEAIIDPPDVLSIHHSYSDSPKLVAQIKCYSANEILAEKIRALYERRGRARDVYDIVNLYRNFLDRIDVNRVKIILQEKFKFKSLIVPAADDIFSCIDFSQLKAGWKDQLGHQLQILPSIDDFYNELKTVLSVFINK
jgi:predicted nucleotidyltransferase component of viral defense system